MAIMVTVQTGEEPAKVTIVGGQQRREVFIDPNTIAAPFAVHDNLELTVTEAIDDDDDN